MKLGQVLSFYATQLTLLKYKQWDLPFTFNNIPANIIDRAFHITVGQVSSGPAENQVMHVFRMPIVIRLFFKGFRDPNTAMANALNEANDIYGALLAPALRLEQGAMRDIRPVSIQPFVLSTTNDNSILLEMAFESILQYRFQ